MVKETMTREERVWAAVNLQVPDSPFDGAICS